MIISRSYEQKMALNPFEEKGRGLDPQGPFRICAPALHIQHDTMMPLVGGIGGL